jgi:hypothetical protein
LNPWKVIYQANLDPTLAELRSKVIVDRVNFFLTIRELQSENGVICSPNKGNQTYPIQLLRRQERVSWQLATVGTETSRSSRWERDEESGHYWISSPQQLDITPLWGASGPCKCNGGYQRVTIDIACNCDIGVLRDNSGQSPAREDQGPLARRWARKHIEWLSITHQDQATTPLYISVCWPSSLDRA